MEVASLCDVETLYRRFGAVIYSRCRRILRSEDEAEDATQEIFARVIRAAPPPSANIERPDAWLYQVCLHHCFNVLRSRKRRKEATAAFVADEVVPADESVLDRELVRKMMVRMPPGLRKPAELRFFAGLEHQAIADALGISRRTVLNRLSAFESRARKYLVRSGLA